MTATISHLQGAQTPTDMHPDWCDLGPACEPQEGDYPPGLTHQGQVTRFTPEHDDVAVTVKLVHHEDVLNGHDHGTAAVTLEIRDIDRTTCGVLLTPGDVDFLIRTLQRLKRDSSGDQFWMDRDVASGEQEHGACEARRTDGTVERFGGLQVTVGATS